MSKLFAYVPVVLLLLFFLLSALLSAGCSSSIPAHDLEAVVTYDGVTTRSVLAFPERDPKAASTPADSSCGLTSGFCGSDAPTYAQVQAEDGPTSPISTATYTTVSSGEAGTYDVSIARTADDDVAYQKMVKEHGAVPSPAFIQCRVYETDLGTDQPCFYSSRTVHITLTRR